jgi:hypothetical protein
MVCNPQPEQVGGESWEALLRLLQTNTRRMSLREHIRLIAERLVVQRTPTEESDENGWPARLRHYGRFSEEDIELLADIRAIATAADNANAEWFILLEPDADWKYLAMPERWPLWWPPWY